MTAITTRHTIVKDAAQKIIHANNTSIVTSGQYESLIRAEGAPVDAHAFSSEMRSGNRETTDMTARKIEQNAPAWREELRAEQEAKYPEARRKAKEEERDAQQQAKIEEERKQQEKKRSEEEEIEAGRPTTGNKIMSQGERPHEKTTP